MAVFMVGSHVVWLVAWWIRLSDGWRPHATVVGCVSFFLLTV